MDQDRKLFGMTKMQIGILAGLAAMVFLVFCITGWLVLANGFKSPLAQPPATVTATLQPTATLVTTPTLTATPAPTPLPYEALIPSGWKQFKTALVEIWLPNNFQLAKKSILGDTTNLAVPELIISEAKSKTSLYNMLAGVSYEPLVGDSLDAFLDGELQKVSPTVRMVERRKVTLNGTPAVRITFEVRVDNIDMNDLTFVFQDGGTVWYVEYAAQINEFYDNLSNFEASAQTFRVVR